MLKGRFCGSLFKLFAKTGSKTRIAQKPKLTVCSSWSFGPGWQWPDMRSPMLRWLTSCILEVRQNPPQQIYDIWSDTRRHKWPPKNSSIFLHFRVHCTRLSSAYSKYKIGKVVWQILPPPPTPNSTFQETEEVGNGPTETGQMSDPRRLIIYSRSDPFLIIWRRSCAVTSQLTSPVFHIQHFMTPSQTFLPRHTYR